VCFQQHFQGLIILRVLQGHLGFTVGVKSIDPSPKLIAQVNEAANFGSF